MMKIVYKYLVVLIVFAIPLSCANNKDSNKKSNSRHINNSQESQNKTYNSELWSNQYQDGSENSIIDKYSLNSLNISDLKKGKSRLDILLNEVTYAANNYMPDNRFKDVDTLASYQMDKWIKSTDDFTDIKVNIDHRTVPNNHIKVIKENKIVDLRWEPYEFYQRFIAVLNLDAEHYFNSEIYDKYETELQKEIYFESDDWKNKLKKLKGIKANLLKTTHYIDLPIRYSISNYDLDTNSFMLERTDDYYKVAMNPNVFQFENLLLKLPNEVELKSNRFDKTVTRLY